MRALSLDRMTRELKQSQRKGLLRAKRVMVRLRGRVLRAYRAGQYEISFVPQVYAELVPITAEAMTIAHFAGIRRSYLMLPRDFKLSLRDDVQEVLKQQISLEDIGLVKEMYSLEATRALGEDARAVERRIEKTMLEIVSSGAHVREGVKILSAEMAGLGISTHRLETIFRTQTQLAYGAARWNADQDGATQEILWGYEYATVGDDRVRDEHEVLDGIKLPKDHPFWQTWWPPNGWNCRCQALPIFEREEMKFPPDDINPEPGFDRNPAHTLSGTRFSLIISEDAPAWLRGTMVEAQRLYIARDEFPKGSEKWKELEAKRLIAYKQVIVQKKGHPEWFGDKKITTVKTPPTIKTAKLKEDLAKLKAERIVAEKELAERRIRIANLKAEGLKSSKRFKVTSKVKSADQHRARVVLDELERVHDKFSAMTERLKEIDKPPRIVLYSQTTLPGHYSGQYNEATQVIELPVRIRQLKSSPDLKLGGFNVDSSLAGTTRHEFGHHVHNVMLSQGESSQWGLIHDSLDVSKISDYAETDSHESFAESFSAYTHPNYKRGELPTEVETFMDDKLKTKT